MTEEFSKLLETNKSKPKDEAGKFELRKVERDSEGKERYIKTEEDDAIFQTKIQEMGQMASMELRDANYETRCKWIEDKKNEGNIEYKAGKYEAAIDQYTSSLCGLAFSKDITKEQKDYVNNSLKIPVLNNLA